MSELLTIKQASEFASKYLGKNVTTSNISYLINYARIKKKGFNGDIFISKEELKSYYGTYYGKREIDWKNQLGDDLNWHLSFDYLKEADTTKHVHRLHPYKGKFIPQLVQYFLDDHTDEFKTNNYFKKGDIILDPFSGSGTALVQSNELGLHAIGIDISAFNSLISNSKVRRYDFKDLHEEIEFITYELKKFITKTNVQRFENELKEELATFNNKYFPSPEFKYKIRNKEFDEIKYANAKANEFLPVYNKLISKYKIVIEQKVSDNFLDKWYLQTTRNEIDFVFDLIKKVGNKQTKKILSIILSRTIRSCRATTHADLATLKDKVTSTYYCGKHGKICKPLFSIYSWWVRYSKDTIKRLKIFDRLRTNTCQICLTGDSRNIDIFKEVNKRYPKFGDILINQKIQGIFSSPPYVGLIDYHEQHAYAYELYGFERRDSMEIGSLSNGSNGNAKQNYLNGISDVLINCKKFLAEDYDVFLVANDKFNMYPTIAENAGMKIVKQFKRPVLNRTEKDKGAYSEIIFHMKEKKNYAI
ncbi:DNA methyltransferase [Bacteroidota bacterium]